MGLAQNVRDYLQKRYNEIDVAGSYFGVDKFYRVIKAEGKIKVTRKQVAEFLSSQTEYTIHRGVKRRFPRRRAIVPHIGYQIEVDCAFMTQYKALNDGYGYFLVAIDCFSKLAHTAPLKSLKAMEVSKALEGLLVKFGRVWNVHSDRGSEFRSDKTQSMLRRLGIKHFYASNETKCFFAERFIRTIKSLIYRYMTSHNTHRWVDVLDSFTTNYNNTYHRSIKRAPSSVTKEDEHHLSKVMYDTPALAVKTTQGFKFELNDTVRISGLKTKFIRDFDEKWSREFFFLFLADSTNKPLRFTL